MLVVQLSDTHVVPCGATYLGHDSERYLRDAIAAIAALAERPTFAIVSGDLVNRGKASEYARFAEIMATLPMPYFVVPGNHDDRDVLRATLAPETFGRSGAARIRYAVDDFDVRLIGIDGNRPPSPGAELDDETFAWLETTLARVRPTILTVHQPPFRTGLHYLDVFGFRGARRLRALVARHPHVGVVASGHIHCVRERHVGTAHFVSAPSTVPTTLPLLFMGGRIVGTRSEAPGFATHAWSAGAGFRSTFYRRDARGAYVASAARTHAG